MEMASQRKRKAEQGIQHFSKTVVEKIVQQGFICFFSLATVNRLCLLIKILNFYKILNTNHKANQTSNFLIKQFPPLHQHRYWEFNASLGSHARTMGNFSEWLNANPDKCGEPTTIRYMAA